jgi:hypothetical protein
VCAVGHDATHLLQPAGLREVDARESRRVTSSMMSSHVKPCQVRSSHVKSCQVMSSQVYRSCQLKAAHLPGVDARELADHRVVVRQPAAHGDDGDGAAPERVLQVGRDPVCARKVLDGEH